MVERAIGTTFKTCSIRQSGGSSASGACPAIDAVTLFWIAGSDFVIKNPIEKTGAFRLDFFGGFHCGLD